MYNFTYNVNSFYGKLEQILDDAGNKIEIKRNYAMHAKEIVTVIDVNSLNNACAASVSSGL
jgi:hypothetical protein